ncbi:MAG: hypothetical protein Kow0077_31720 [Anaerolineae bacterium]
MRSKVRLNPLSAILLIAFALRVATIVPALHNDRNLFGGDYAWYAREGRTLLRTGWLPGPPPTGPVFLLTAGLAEELGTLGRHDLPGYLLQRMIGGPTLFPRPVGDGLPFVRLLHILLGTLTVWMVYRIGRAAWDERTGLLAALAVAINPLFILEAGNPATESLALFLLSWALAIWLEQDHPAWPAAVKTGLLLALAALTRSALLGIPVLLVGHLLVKHGWRRAAQHSLILLTAWLLTFSPWTLYNWVTWDRLTLSGEGFIGMLYVGAAGWKDPEVVDAELGFTPDMADDPEARQESFLNGLKRIVLTDPAAYARKRLGELTGALLQPHNTAIYPGPGIKQLALDWLRSDRTPGGLLEVTRADHFWQKLLLYLFHYPALILGAIGLFISRREWRRRFPLYGVFAYFLGMHTLLSAIPRYLFPLEMFWWLFAAALVVRWYDHRRIASAPQTATIQA